MSIFVVRAFVHMREVLATNQKLVAKPNDLEKKVRDHDCDIQEIVDVIREIRRPLPSSARNIGFELPASVLRLQIATSKRAQIFCSLCTS